MKIAEISSDWGPLLNPNVGQLSPSVGHLDCVRCSASQLPLTDPRYFNAKSKCCSYWPVIANYKVEDLKERLEFIDEWIETKPFVLPLGILPDPRFQIQREMQPKELQCPYLSQDSRCTIWSKRPARCATFFCSNPSPRDAEIWETIYSLADHFEMGLAQAWMVEAGFRWSEIELLLAQIESPNLSHLAEVHHQAWAHWRHRKQEYFTRAFEWRRQLTFNEIKDWLGPKWQELQQNQCLTSIGDGLTSRV